MKDKNSCCLHSVKYSMHTFSQVSHSEEKEKKNKSQIFSWSWETKTCAEVKCDFQTSGEVRVEENVNADEQEGVSTAEPGPEHALSQRGDHGSGALLRALPRRHTEAHPLTTHHAARWLRA